MTKIEENEEKMSEKEENLTKGGRYFGSFLSKLAKTLEDMTPPLFYKSAKDEIKAELKEIKGAGEIGRGMKLPAILSREECFELMNAYKKGKLAFKNNLIIRLLYATGVRVEELANFKFCDINYDNQTIFVRSGKGEKDRYVCVDEETLNLLRKWQEGKSLSDFIIGLSIRQIRRIVEKAGEITGISQKYDAMGRVFSCHSLRHAFATHSFENGMRTLTLMKLLGHEYLATTQIYIYSSMKYDLEEYRRTNPLR